MTFGYSPEIKFSLYWESITPTINLFCITLIFSLKVLFYFIGVLPNILAPPNEIMVIELSLNCTRPKCEHLGSTHYSALSSPGGVCYDTDFLGVHSFYYYFYFFFSSYSLVSNCCNFLSYACSRKLRVSLYCLRAHSCTIVYTFSPILFIFEMMTSIYYLREYVADIYVNCACILLLILVLSLSRSYSVTFLLYFNYLLSLIYLPYLPYLLVYLPYLVYLIYLDGLVYFLFLLSLST